MSAEHDPWRADTPEETRALLESIRNGPPPSPDIAHMFYAGQTHTLSGKSDAGKSLFLALVARDQINAGQGVLWIDHEQGRRRLVRRLMDFGATDEALENHLFRIHHPIGDSPAGFMDAFEGVRFAVVDAFTGALTSRNLSSNSDVDIEQVYNRFLRPLAELGAGVVTIDHLGHMDPNRPIGSGRKTGAPDVELMFKAVQQFKAGHGGRAAITIGRDRDGAIVPCEFVLGADYSWRLEFAAGDWKPTELMERISIYLEAQTEPVSKATIERDVKGTDKYKREALEALISDGYVMTEGGLRGAILCSSVTPYRKPAVHDLGTSVHLGGTSAGRGGATTSAPRLSPYKGETSSAEVEHAATDNLGGTERHTAEGHGDALELVLAADPGTTADSNDRTHYTDPRGIYEFKHTEAPNGKPAEGATEHDSLPPPDEAEHHLAEAVNWEAS
jgi:hypothetical protein